MVLLVLFLHGIRLLLHLGQHLPAPTEVVDLPVGVPGVPVRSDYPTVVHHLCPGVY